MLRLTGKWLARAGFLIGTPIEIEVRRAKLIIRAAKAEKADQVTTRE
jgi:Fe2+ transport system protein FeoA